jgi:RNA polymerase sigma-70 factor (ECF subfamily)
MSPGQSATNPEPSDEDLMILIQQGDETAFSRLIDRRQDLVYRLALRMTGRDTEARDIAQDVFLGIWENPGAFKPSARFSTWLFRVTTNRAISTLRLRKVRAFFSLDTGEDADSIPDDSVLSPDKSLEKREEAEHLREALLRLPTRQRAAIHLRYQEELSVVEVAESLGVSFKSAESLLFRAKVSLKKMLGEE